MNAKRIFSLILEKLTEKFIGISAGAIIIGTMLAIIGSIVAIGSLNVISKTHKLESIRDFFKDIEETAEDRRFILQKFNFNIKKPIPLTNNVEEKVQKVVNSLSHIGLLLDNKLLSSKIVFGIYHATIIRCWYKLKDYVIHTRTLRGGMYGKRIFLLDEQARNYHDIHPEHRRTKIMLYQGSKKPRVMLYETKIEKGIIKGIRQRIIWSKGRLLEFIKY